MALQWHLPEGSLEAESHEAQLARVTDELLSSVKAANSLKAKFNKLHAEEQQAEQMKQKEEQAKQWKQMKRWQEDGLESGFAPMRYESDWDLPENKKDTDVAEAVAPGKPKQTMGIDGMLDQVDSWQDGGDGLGMKGVKEAVENWRWGAIDGEGKGPAKKTQEWLKPKLEKAKDMLMRKKFKEDDTDHDGALSEKEFVDAAASVPLYDKEPGTWGKSNMDPVEKAAAWKAEQDKARDPKEVPLQEARELKEQAMTMDTYYAESPEKESAVSSALSKMKEMAAAKAQNTYNIAAWHVNDFKEDRKKKLEGKDERIAATRGAVEIGDWLKGRRYGDRFNNDKFNIPYTGPPATEDLERELQEAHAAGSEDLKMRRSADFKDTVEADLERLRQDATANEWKEEKDSMTRPAGFPSVIGIPFRPLTQDQVDARDHPEGVKEADAAESLVRSESDRQEHTHKHKHKHKHHHKHTHKLHMTAEMKAQARENAINAGDRAKDFAKSVADHLQDADDDKQTNSIPHPYNEDNIDDAGESADTKGHQEGEAGDEQQDQTWGEKLQPKRDTAEEEHKIYGEDVEDPSTNKASEEMEIASDPLMPVNLETAIQALAKQEHEKNEADRKSDGEIEDVSFEKLRLQTSPEMPKKPEMDWKEWVKKAYPSPIDFVPTKSPEEVLQLAETESSEGAASAEEPSYVVYPVGHYFH